MDHAQNVAEANEAHEKALAEIHRARAAFDATGADSDLAALERAKHQASMAEERLGRAERLLTEDDARQEATWRAALEAERDVIESQLDQAGIAEATAKLDEREVAARVVLADLALERTELCMQTRALVFRSAVIARELGMMETNPPERRAHGFEVQIQARRPVERMLERAMVGVTRELADALRSVRP